MHDEAVHVVQFIHPGAEHGPDSPGLKHWNTGPHRRKFLQVEGESCGDDGRVRKEGIRFWGEWEPPSTVEELESGPGLPRHLHRPLLQRFAPGSGQQNTDPFVFGGPFLYTGCQQWRGEHPVRLRYLLPGSILLFGSCVSGQFVLDTVLVVRDSIDHCRQDHCSVLPGRVPDAYWDVTLGPWYAGPEDGRSWRLYRGAAVDDPLNRMFSFFPCRPADDSTRGFARPSISLPRIITPHLTQGWRSEPLHDLDDATAVWRNVRAAVLAHGCHLGVAAAIPEMRSIHGSGTPLVRDRPLPADCGRPRPNCCRP